MKRREVIKKTGLGLATAVGLSHMPLKSFSLDTAKLSGERKINLFSKHLQWVGSKKWPKSLQILDLMD